MINNNNNIGKKKETYSVTNIHCTFRWAGIQISKVHYTARNDQVNNERYTAKQNYFTFLMVGIRMRTAAIVRTRHMTHVHLLDKPKEQVLHCTISRGHCFSFVRSISGQKNLLYVHRKKAR